jgi:1,4-alpha-glucan branching enzyme
MPYTNPIGELDLHLLNEGTHQRLYDALGAHLGGDGCHFGVWAPNASQVSVIGDWNDWDPTVDVLAPVASSGVWSGHIAGVKKGAKYKFRIVNRETGQVLDKADPYALHAETPPFTASIVWDLDYAWGDDAWCASRRHRFAREAPVSIYECHLGSWRRGKTAGALLSYRDLAALLADHVQACGFTHVELLPVMEHPFYGSWGYQVTGYFAPTSRHGTPQEFMYLVDYLHQRGIGVILDWVPAHFPNDPHGLAQFDGTALYEHADPRRGFHPDWKSCIFNYDRHEVRAFLLSSARFWMEKYRVDGLRVDGVASMLYLDYSRREGEWIPNEHGGRENLGAISLLKELNYNLYGAFPENQTIAEESTAWPKVSRPVYDGGLGFGYKWDMGWMHDTLRYFSRDPLYRKYHHNDLTFRSLYAFHENFVLSISHDEVVHGKGSMLVKMPGDTWQKFANVRCLYGYMFSQPGKKHLFMGAEFGQWQEWNHDSSLDWHLLDYEPLHGQLMRYVAELNRLYRTESTLHQLDCDPEGFEWISGDDADNSVLSYLRKDKQGHTTVVVLNFTPITRADYRVGVPHAGGWTELLNSDSRAFGGSGVINHGRLEAQVQPWHGRSHSLQLTLPPLGAVFLRPVSGG